MGSGGKGSKETKVGTKYFYGFVLVPLRQHDALLEIELNDKPAWRGGVGQGRITIQKPNLFGGDEREGGFVGEVDVQDGNSEQAVNTYLQDAKSTLTSAMRGCVSLVFRRPYIGANTARLPSIRTKHRNFAGISRGWNRADEIIVTNPKANGAFFFVVVDLSPGVRLASRGHIKGGLAGWARSLKGSTNSIKIFGQNRKVVGDSIPLVVQEITRYNCTDQDYEDIAVFAENLDYEGASQLTVNQADISGAPDFFSPSASGSNSFTFSLRPRLTQTKESTSLGRRFIIFLNATGGTASDAIIASTGAAVGVIGMQTADGSYDGNTDLRAKDNTEFDGVPEPQSDLATTEALQKLTSIWLDMNPAHIIRCLWTDPMRGGSVGEDEIGDSFDTAADLYLEERLGLSCKFRGLDQADSDRVEVERHIDAMSFRSNRTGKIEIVSIRDDYIVDDLLTLDTSIVKDWSGVGRPRRSETPNQLTVRYTRRDGKTGSVTRTNVAGVRRAGRVIKAQTVDYLFCTTEALAVRLCLRDLRSVSSEMLTGTLPLSYLPEDIEPGSVVVLNNPTLGIDNVIARVTETRIGQYDNSEAVITIAEDKYASTQPVDIPDTPDPGLVLAKAADPRLVQEVSYFRGVQIIGQTSLDEELEEEPDLGRLLATGVKADANQLSATLALKVDTDLWDDLGLVDFQPYATLVDNLSADPSVTTFTVSENASLSSIFAGDLAQLGTEIIRIDDLTDNEDGTFTVTCGRGCLDGPPAFHLAGSSFVLVEDAEPIGSEYIAGQSAEVKMLSRTGVDALDLNTAPSDTLTFASRAVRPYNVGNLKLAGSFTPGILSGAVTGTWTHRDRTLQTTPAVDDYLADNIGPETGVAYTGWRRLYPQLTNVFSAADVFAVRDCIIDFESFTETEVSLSSATATTEDFDTDDIDVFVVADVFSPTDVFEGSFNDNTRAMGFAVKVTRGAYDNSQTPAVVFTPLLPPLSFEAFI